MGKISACSVVFDDVIQIDIKRLAKNGVLHQKALTRMNYSWWLNDELFSAVSILINTNSLSPYITLSYIHDGINKKYDIILTSIASNLNRGKIWYFLCPWSGLRCRKLYFIDGIFGHRNAFPGHFYETQIEAKSYRCLRKYFSHAFDVEKSYEKINSKHFKKYYAGRMTKRYEKLLRKIS